VESLENIDEVDCAVLPEVSFDNIAVLLVKLPDVPRFGFLLLQSGFLNRYLRRRQFFNGSRSEESISAVVSFAWSTQETQVLDV
jgi:hypothetical protein